MSYSSTNPTALPVGPIQETSSKAPRSEKTPGKKVSRELGLKVTTQRLSILEVIRNGASHFTAQDVFESVAQQDPEIGFATVYRFLRTLSEHRYVTEIRMGGMPARYEWAGKRHHDHLTCVQCSKIVEFENSEIEQLQEKVAKQFNFVLSSHVLELYGVCPQCQKKSFSPSTSES